MAGPLSGLRIIELAGIGPGPFAAMMLADHGAEGIRSDRPGARIDARDPLLRSRRLIGVDLKSPEGKAKVRELVKSADGLIEGFRPGVTERLGLGPEVLLADNPRLVYGRMTGWGQTGPLARTAGHDIDYLALSGALHAIGHAGGRPVPPLNYVADYGGGAMFLAFGLMAALHEARGSGQGQVVDAAMTEGASLLSSIFHGLRAAGEWSERRGENLLDSGAPFYDTYACADGRFLALGALEPQFQAELLQRLGITEPELAAPVPRERWPQLRERLTALLATRSRDDWCTVFEGGDACVAPVLDWDEAPRHPQHQARSAFIELDGVTQAAPAPRFSRTPAARPTPPVAPGADTEAILRDWGVDAAVVERLRGGA